jgi:hypothetical protein
MKHTKHYTAADIESAIEDEQAKLLIWRYEALRAPACSGRTVKAQSGQRKQPSHGKPTSAD